MRSESQKIKISNNIYNMNLKEFIIKYKIKWMAIKIKIDGNKKNPIDGSDYNKFKVMTFEQCQKMKTGGKNTTAIDTFEIQQFDLDYLDNLKFHKKFIEKIKNAPYYKSLTKPDGKHYFIKVTGIEKNYYGVGSKKENNLVGELLTGMWAFAPFDMSGVEVFNSNNEIPEIDINDIKQINKTASEYGENKTISPLDELINNKYCDKNAVDVILDDHKNKFLYIPDEKRLYYCNDYGLWVKEERELNNFIDTLCKDVKNKRIEMSKKATEGNNHKIEGLIQNISTIISRLGDNKTRKNVREYLCSSVSNNKAKEMFDSVNLFSIMFNDGLYDFKENVLRPAKPEEYVTKTTGYKFPKRNEKHIDKIHELFLNELFEDDETRDYLLKVYASCLFGVRRFEQFYILTGRGRNGKGSIDTLIKRCFGDYYINCDMSAFTKTKKSSNECSSTLSKACGTRILSSTEPETNETLQIGLLKQLRGGDPLTVRDLYQSAFTYKPQFTMIFQANDIPDLSKLDKAIAQTIRIINFPFTFNDNPTGQTQKKALPDLKEKYLSSNDWRNAMIHILMDTFKKDILECHATAIKEPQSVLNTMNEYLEDNNPVLMWIKENYHHDKADKTNKNHWYLSTDIREMFNSQSDNKLGVKQFTQSLKFNDIEMKKSNGVRFLIGEERKEEEEEQEPPPEIEIKYHKKKEKRSEKILSFDSDME
jgi:P4 family phage/plasmid primase-like protien